MLMPKRVKHRKVQRGRRAGMAKGGTTVSFGDFGLMAEEVCWLTSRQIEAARRAMTHHIKRGGRVWIRVFPDKPVTKKPAEVRMGSGKGAPDHWVAVVKPGRVMFEMSGVPARRSRARRMRLASHKLPINTRFVMKEGLEHGHQLRCERPPTRTCEGALRDAKQELWKVRFDLATRQESNYSGCRRPASGSPAS